MTKWHHEGTVILGDAGYAMSPQLGQGVNLALADAACLAKCVERFPLGEALARYSRERKLALAYYRFVAASSLRGSNPITNGSRRSDRHSSASPATSRPRGSS